MSNKSPFKLKSEFEPTGDQPTAVKKLVEGIDAGLSKQTLLGVTGSGKTFSMANVIQQVGKPTLVIAHNKTLAAQLAQEYMEFFPDNAVHYFVSYYDFYQPEAYIASSDTYIEKEAQINKEIERLRHASTQALLSRDDVIIVSSVSCIYGLGSPEEYKKVHLQCAVGDSVVREQLLKKLVSIYFERTTADLEPGMFRVVANKIEIMPVNERVIYRLSIDGGVIDRIEKIDAISRAIISSVDDFYLFPAKHYITPEKERDRALKAIAEELEVELKRLNDSGMILEAERLKRRTRYDMALIKEVGYCNGIENYSRHFDGRKAGEPPYSLLDYFPKDKNGKPDFLTIIDESHATLPQIHAMQAGDKSRKEALVQNGFRLPSACDNRPLTYEEFIERVGQTIYTSATPSKYELAESDQIVEQVIRPTGLIDPEVIIRPVVGTDTYGGQIADFITEAETVIKNGGRVIATTLTKKMAEDLSVYLKDRNIKSEYIHSDIKTIERIEILTAFRKGDFDCIVGVNLLREGLDLPEVEFIGILDADKEGFLRSETALIQIIGRAARNVLGRVVLYADVVTGSIERAIKETSRRRSIQVAYNTEHGITPTTIKKKISDVAMMIGVNREAASRELALLDQQTSGLSPKKLIKEKEKQMKDAIKDLDFETAAVLRDEIEMIKLNDSYPQNKVKRAVKKTVKRI